jgi:hypothetical protein
MRHRTEGTPNAWQGVGVEGSGQNRQTNCAFLGTSDHEARIASLGQDLINAQASGDKASAQQYLRAMHQAISQRAPASQAKRFAEIDQAIAASDGCYFMDAGDRDRARLGGAK